MGETLAKAHPNVDSPTQPGLSSVVSDPLDSFCNRETLWTELGLLLRDPLLVAERPVLKEVELTENGPADVTMRVVLDGKKLKHFKLAESEEDVVAGHTRIQFFREKWELVVTEFEPKDGTTVRNWTTARLLEDPLRMECWMVKASGKRSTGEVLAGYIERCILQPILLGLKTCSVQVHCNVAHPENGGLCVISESLEEFFFDYDALWREMLSTLKHLHTGVAGFLVKLGNEKFSELEFQDVSDKQFILQQFVPTPGPLGFPDADSQSVLRLLNFSFDENTGELRVESSLNGQREEVATYQILREPFRIAYWKEDKNGRSSGRDTGGELRIILRAMIDGTVENAEGQFFF